MSALDADRLFETCVRHGATDVWLIPGWPPMLRTGGGFRELDVPPLDCDDVLATVGALAPPGQLNDHLSREGRFAFEHVYRDTRSFRVNVFRPGDTHVAVISSAP